MITADLATFALPACFGVLCPLHSQCARYAAVNVSQADPNTLATCLEGERFPMFVALGKPEPAAVVPG